MVAPLIAAPFFCHWYVKGCVPEAATVNVAVCPAITVALAGWLVTLGGTALAVTVNSPAVLVTLPAEFEITT